MTTAMIESKKIALSIYEKSLLLSVYEVQGQGGYTVSSGSEVHKAYRVSSDCAQCGCDSRVLCSHRIAAQNYKDTQCQPQAPRYSEVCGHLVKVNVHRHCGCMA